MLHIDTSLLEFAVQIVLCERFTAINRQISQFRIKSATKKELFYKVASEMLCFEDTSQDMCHSQ